MAALITTVVLGVCALGIAMLDDGQCFALTGIVCGLAFVLLGARRLRAAAARLVRPDERPRAGTS